MWLTILQRSSFRSLQAAWCASTPMQRSSNVISSYDSLYLSCYGFLQHDECILKRISILEYTRTHCEWSVAMLCSCFQVAMAGYERDIAYVEAGSGTAGGTFVRCIRSDCELIRALLARSISVCVVYRYEYTVLCTWCLLYLYTPTFDSLMLVTSTYCTSIILYYSTIYTYVCHVSFSFYLDFTLFG